MADDDERDGDVRLPDTTVWVVWLPSEDSAMEVRLAQGCDMWDMANRLHYLSHEVAEEAELRDIANERNTP